MCALVLFQEEEKRSVPADLSLKACFDLKCTWESTGNPGIHSNNAAKCQRVLEGVEALFGRRERRNMDLGGGCG